MLEVCDTVRVRGVVIQRMKRAEVKVQLLGVIFEFHSESSLFLLQPQIEKGANNLCRL